MSLRKFFYREWWAYVLDDSHADKDFGPWDVWFRVEKPWDGEFVANPFARLANYLVRCYCRASGHRCGVFWNSSGLEPDMRCVGCGEDLG
jgi:hypothetical protein